MAFVGYEMTLRLQHWVALIAINFNDFFYIVLLVVSVCVLSGF
jgi:hypothetical protein